jgi:general secretion pathway protein C
MRDSALISVDGKPAKAFRIGALVDGQNVLQSVHARGASLGPRGGPTAIALNIPPPVAAATGQLPNAGMPQQLQPQMRPLPGVLPTGGLPPQLPQGVPVPQMHPLNAPPPNQVPPPADGGLLK